MARRRTRRRKNKKKTRRFREKFQSGGGAFKIIASMTTVPGRIDKLQDVIKHVLNQNVPVDHLEFNIPEVLSKTKEPYVIPDWLTKMEKVVIFRTPDLGPVTKIAPTLIRNPSDYVWSVDDDRIYPEDTLKGLVDAIDTANPSIIAYEGGNFKDGQFINGVSGNQDVQVVEGFRTILYPPNAIKGDFQSYIDTIQSGEDSKYQDDIVLGNYFAKYKVKRRVVPMISFATELGHSKDKDALHQTGDGNNSRAVRVMNWLKEKNMWYIT